jgi:HMG (high mobility group) box
LLQQLNEEAVANKHANDKVYDDWLKTHPAEAIWRSNKAGALLRGLRKKDKLKIHVPRTIQDTRQIKRPMNPYAHFYKDKVDSGVMKGLAISEIGKLIGQQWREAPATERQVSEWTIGESRANNQQRYKDVASADAAKFKQDAERVYGHIPSLRK